MKVKPHIKRRPLSPNEIRVITINENAIAELLLENLMEHKSEYFNIADITSNCICLMNWEQKSNLLTYAVVPIELAIEGYELNYEYIQESLGITVNSLFESNRYKSVVLTERMIKKKTGDGVVSSE